MKTLNARSKYFNGDHALFYAVSGAAGAAEAAKHGILENIAVNELFRRGYELYSGKIDRHIIDFVGRSGNKTLCVQTLLRGVEDEEEAEKKYAALLRVPRIASKLPLKYVVFCDKTREAAMRTAARALDAKDGVLFMSLPDFLQSAAY
jgi:predicted AAA+ superfamily ATPase